jgi:hypothetical protein
MVVYVGIWFIKGIYSSKVISQKSIHKYFLPNRNKKYNDPGPRVYVCKILSVIDSFILTYCDHPY